MPRTTDTAVKAIIDTGRDTTPFIATASRQVDRYTMLSGLSDATDGPLLTDMETYWAAHLVAITEPRSTRRRLGETSIDYQQGQLAMGLKSTFYGQTVLDLDPTGQLASTIGVQAASFNVD